MKYLFIVWLQICSFYLFASDNKNPFISELNEDSTSELSDKQKIELKECMEQGRPWHTKENKCLEWDNIVIHSTPHDSTSNASKKQELSVTEKQNLIAKKVLYTTLINVEGQEVLPLKLLFKSLPRKMDIILDDLVLIYMKNLSTNEDINEIVNGYVTHCLGVEEGIKSTFLKDLLRKDIREIFADAIDNNIIIL